MHSLQTPFVAFATLGLLALVTQASGAQSPSPAPAQSLPLVVGTMPDSSGTPCPGEGQRHETHAPEKATLPAYGVTQFHAHNTGDTTTILVKMRYDGQSSVAFSPKDVLDPSLRQAIFAYVEHITIDPTIPHCAQPAQSFRLEVNVTDGTVRFPDSPEPRASATAPPR